ncbi:Cas4 family exonuclease [Gordonia phage Forza]|uniref:Cas4 family exonuclease n=1 Tax=Gordonia phage Forza TaxID=2571247 RepID=A0A650EZ63_9CAUD|nr:exonuclease [Gordonia phage Forza]QEM41603.1 Cas4 family exonuclease [Gordonia phage Boopy]QGT55129.1 Cas4 family exonuclease [Gordonia phage Forza]UXE04277.1 Cas4 family exonuclease [Gordonia phage BlueNGold]WBF03918.1 Cas4 family exonuclease [Gordonia phage Mareelih]
MTQLGLESRIPRINNGIRVSQSDLAAFKADRREWLLSSYLGLKPKDEPVYGPLRLGTRVHAALERYYGYGHELVDTYVEIAHDELRKLEESKVVFDVSAWQREAELGRIMLAGYAEWLEETGADANLEILGAEEKLSHLVEIDGVTVELRGKIDLRARDTFTGQNLVIDWKTTANMAWLSASAPHSEQLLTYMTLERLQGDGHPDEYLLQGARFVMLRKVRRTGTAKPPFYDTIEVHHNKTRLRNYYTQLLGTLADYVRVVKALDESIDHRFVAYPNASTHKRWSPYNALTQMMDDGSDVEAMIADLFVQNDPHERYADPHASLLDHLDD